MSAQVLLNLLNELGKRIKCETCRAFYLYFATNLINSILQELECWILLYVSQFIKITLKLHFCHDNFEILSSFTQC